MLFQAVKKSMACEQGNLFGIPEEHQVIFCPNSFSPFAKIHSSHLLSILYACYRHYTIVTFFTQHSSHHISLHPVSNAFFIPFPVPITYSLTLPPYSNLYSINPILCSNFVPLSVSLFLLPLPPPNSSKSLLHFCCLKPTLPSLPFLSSFVSSVFKSSKVLPSTSWAYKRSSAV